MAFVNSLVSRGSNTVSTTSFLDQLNTTVASISGREGISTNSTEATEMCNLFHNSDSLSSLAVAFSRERAHTKIIVVVK